MIALYIVLGILAILVLHVLFVWILSAFVKDKEYDKINRFYRSVYIYHYRLAMFVSNLKIKRVGLDKLKEIKGRYVLVENHRSNYDPFLTLVALKEKELAFISKPENFKIPIFGKIVKKCGYLAIDRENPKNAIKTINRAADFLKKDVVSIGVYPEGTRSHGKELLPFHDGVFKIAQKAGVPVVVVAITGTEKIHKRAPFKRTVVTVEVAKIISAEEVKQKTSHELSDIAREVLTEKTAEK